MVKEVNKYKKKRNFTKTLYVDLTEEEKTDLQRYCDIENISQSEFIRAGIVLQKENNEVVSLTKRVAGQNALEVLVTEDMYNYVINITGKLSISKTLFIKGCIDIRKKKMERC